MAVNYKSILNSNFWFWLDFVPFCLVHDQNLSLCTNIAFTIVILLCGTFIIFQTFFKCSLKFLYLELVSVGTICIENASSIASNIRPESSWYLQDMVLTVLYLSGIVTTLIVLILKKDVFAYFRPPIGYSVIYYFVINF